MTKPKKIRSRADITPDLVKRVTECAAAGCTFQQTSLLVGIEETSLRRWMISHYNEGRARIIRNAGATLANMAVGQLGSDGKWIQRPNLGALMFFLKCQGGWRETAAIEPDDVSIDVVRIELPDNHRA